MTTADISFHLQTGQVFRLRRLRLCSGLGFSFAEVMFAVVILGVGFIMVACVFPVAAEQTRATNDQSIAAQLARDAVNTIRSTTANAQFTDVTGHVASFAANLQLWDQVATGMICKADRRYACVPFYSRTSMQDPVCVTVLVVRRSNGYSASDESASDGALVPKNISIGIRRLSNGTNVVEVAHDTQGSFNAVAQGCYLIVASGDGQGAGHVLQVGSLLSQNAEVDSWSLAPAYNLIDESCSDGSTAMIVGKDYVDPGHPEMGYTGGAQDISVFKTYLLGN